jgi:sterol desaturase/sphingolipid hydroxylase (fatty acid hydroxylase superfamily)
MDRQRLESPFMKRKQVRLSFGTMLILLLMVVGAGVGVLLYYAMRVPAITSELNAWLGRPDADINRGDARRAQVTFALFVYTAPLALGIFVYLAHYVVNWLNYATRPDPENDDQFRMDA